MSRGKDFLGHPKGLFYLFFAELWERFSFYGMRALLTLYMVEQVFASLANRDVVSAIIYSSYGSLVYAFPVVGGKIADQFLGYRKAIILGGTLMAIGHFVLAIEDNTAFFLALSFIIIGNGFFKPNISTFVGALYPHADTRKESGFTIFYMGINIGGFAAPLACGMLAYTYGWHYGFGLAGVGMVLGLLVFLVGIKKGVFGDQGLPPFPERLEKRYLGLKLKHLIPVLALLMVPVISFLISSYGFIAGGDSFLGDITIVNLIFYALGIIILIYLAYEIFRSEPAERGKLVAAIFLTLFMTLFRGFFELSGSILTLFAARNVALPTFDFSWVGLGSWAMDAAQTNSINSFFIILLALPISFLWRFLSKRRINPRTPYKSFLGLAFLGASFYVLYLSGGFANEQGYVPFSFLALMYLIMSTGELLMSPIGLSKITDLSPKRIVAFMMGIWFLSSAFAFQIVGFIGKKLAIEGDAESLQETAQESAFKSLDLYTDGFLSIAYVSFGGALLALICAPILVRIMREVN